MTGYFKAIESSLNIINRNLDTHTDYNLKYPHTLVMINYALEQAVTAGLKAGMVKKGRDIVLSKVRKGRLKARSQGNVL